MAINLNSSICDLCGMAELVVKIPEKKIYVKNDYITKVSINRPVQMEEKIIPLAALLHDLGKFWQGAGGGGKHAELSGRFVQGHVPWEGVVELVSLHHDPSKYESGGYKPLNIWS